PDPGRGSGGGGHFVFVGRLSPEKGLNVLLDAWSRLSTESPDSTDSPDSTRPRASHQARNSRPITLEILGDGPLADDVRRAASADSRIRWLGQRPISEVLERVGTARGLLLPSLCYENCPKTLLEALALGTPVIASRVGALAEMVDDRITGRLFEVGDGAALARTIRQFVDESDNDARNAAYRDAARAAFETRYAADRNYAALMAVYESVGVERTAGAEVTS
ncbi:MAG TPA: glycosyltransferase, partial [Pirellulaceae bacterium]|nr:glycosyltransferase [Pirellulaceae bacterium]